MLVRAALQFLVSLAVATGITLALAAIWTLASGGSFADRFATGCLVIGALTLIGGALGVGGMSPSQGLVETSGRLPGVRAYMRTSPGTNSVSITAILILAGVSLIAVGTALY